MELVAYLAFLSCAFLDGLMAALITDCGPGTYYQGGSCITGSPTDSANLYTTTNTASTYYPSNTVYTNPVSNSYTAAPYYNNGYPNSYPAPYYYGSNVNSYYPNTYGGNQVCVNGACYPSSNTVLNNANTYTNYNTGGAYCYSGVCYGTVSSTNGYGYSCATGTCTFYY